MPDKNEKARSRGARNKGGAHATEFDRAMILLEELIGHIQRQGCEWLPSVESMAKMGCISTRAVSAALAELKTRGTLHAVRGVGIRLTPNTGDSAGAPCDVSETEDPSNPPTHKSSWVWVKRRVAQDILRGVFPPGSRLPTAKELQERYGVCFTTIRHALHALCDEERLMPDRRGYRVYAAQSSVHSASIVVLSRYESVLNLVSRTPHSFDFWRTLELGCTNRAVNIESLPVHPRTVHRQCSYLLNRMLKSTGRPILGFVIDMIGMDDSILNPLLANLVRLKRAIIAYDENGVYTLPTLAARVGRDTYLRSIRPAVGSTAGHAMGNHLIAQGHRSVALFVIQQDARWSRLRGEGMRRAFMEVGIDGQPRCFTLEVDTADGPLRPCDGREASGFQVREYFNTVYCKGIGEPIRTPTDSKVPVRPLPPVFERFLEWSAQVLAPRFEEALSDPDITAWVGANDTAALIAQRFLRSHPNKDTNDIALAGFDDTLGAVGAGLTSYNFNVSAAVHEILHQILDCRPHTPADVEIPGTVACRESTATPRGGQKPPGFGLSDLKAWI